jgi:hypothetical protein
MGLNETVFGSPGQTQVHQTAGSKPPGFNFARDFFNSLGGIAQSPYPTYQGQLDPGLSPTMQNVLRQAQGYAQSGPPEILAGVQGSLGRFMNPNFTNPAARFGQGVPDYFNQNPNQTVYNGGTPGGLQGVFGAQGPTGMGGPKPAAAPPPGPVGFNGPVGAGQPSSGSLPPMPSGKGLGGPGSDMGYQTPPYAGGYGNDAFSDPSGPGGGPLSFPGGQSDMQDFTKPFANVAGAVGGMGGAVGGLSNIFSPGGLPAPDGATPMGGPNTMHPTNPAAGGGQGSYGGYSVDQLQHDPGLASRLGPHAAALWRAFGGGQAGGPNTMHPINPGMPHRGGPGGKPMRDPRTGGIAVQPPPEPGMQYGGPGAGK